MRELILIVHNVRSAHNVGSLLRTADGLGIQKVILSGYTPYPTSSKDERLPHLSRRITSQIHKTALGAENTVQWQQQTDIHSVIQDLHRHRFTVAALEQAIGATQLPDFQPPARLALVVGREVDGIEPEVVTECDMALEIPMLGAKESFNVAQAAAMALYHCRFTLND